MGKSDRTLCCGVSTPKPEPTEVRQCWATGNKVTGMEQMSWSERKDTLHKLAARLTSHHLERQVHFQEMLHDTTRITLEVLYPRNSELNKVVLFDKGCTFLCVFGLTGEKLHHKNTHALQSAIQIFQSCSTMLKDVEEVSVAVINVAVTPTFCGDIGHPERHEYTGTRHVSEVQEAGMGENLPSSWSAYLAYYFFFSKKRSEYDPFMVQNMLPEPDVWCPAQTGAAGDNLEPTGSAVSLYLHSQQWQPQPQLNSTSPTSAEVVDDHS
ncbi:hypothetical protein Q9966_014181 [Columba livia]|nr:hypothetical protein Q9966_014181 [Columba livia]